MSLFNFQSLSPNPITGDLGIQFGDIFTWKGHGGAMFLGHQVFWANAFVAFIDFGPLAYLYYRFSRPVAGRGQSW